MEKYIFKRPSWPGLVPSCENIDFACLRPWASVPAPNTDSTQQLAVLDLSLAWFSIPALLIPASPCFLFCYLPVLEEATSAGQKARLESWLWTDVVVLNKWEFTVPVWYNQGLHPAADFSSNGLKHWAGFASRRPFMWEARFALSPQWRFLSGLSSSFAYGGVWPWKIAWKLVRNAAILGNPRKDNWRIVLMGSR